MEVEWQTLLKNQAAKSLEETSQPERAGRIARWTLVGPVLESQTTASHRGAVRKQD